MNWVEAYRLKAKKNKKMGALILLLTVLSIPMGVMLLLLCSPFLPGGGGFIYLLSFLASIGFVISISYMQSKIVWRRYNGYDICFYIGPIKNYLIIENEIQYEGGPFTRYYYGQLPDRTAVAIKITAVFGNVKFAIGEFNNINMSFF